MQEKHLFEYAIIRVVPRVEREEFINVGVILYCAGKNFLQIRCELKKKRLHALCDDIDMDDLKQRLKAFGQVCEGKKDGGPIGQLPPASRFRWLTSARSTIVQTSPVHPGLCEDPQETLKHLFEQMVCH